MKTVISHTFSSEKPWHTNYDASDQSLELSFAEDINDSDIDEYLQLVSKMVNYYPVKTLFINDSKIENDPLRFDWKIIEASWQAICRNGGKKIVLIHQHELPGYMKEYYSDAVKGQGTSVKLEFKST